MDRDDVMTRNEAGENLVAYVDGELQSEDRRRFEALLLRDAALADEVARLREADRLLDLDEPLRPREGFTGSVLARLRADRRRRWVVRTAAAVLVVAGIAFGVARLSALASTEEVTDSELVRYLDLLEDLEVLEELGDDIEFLSLAQERS